MDTYLLKFGGNAIRGRDDLDRLAKEIVWLVNENVNIVLVHGGGPEITEEMERRGLEAKKIAGVRITDDDALKVAMDVLESINNDVVDSLKGAGVDAKGMSGIGMIHCVKKPPVTLMENGTEIVVDLGKVGIVKDVDVGPIMKALTDGFVPVIYPICSGPSGEALNVNADTAAAGVAAAIKAKEMIQITDVPGILTDINDETSKLNTVTLDEVNELIKNGTISGGMIPKVEACRDAIDSGVGTVRMVNGKDKRSIVTDVLKNIPHGTVIIR